MGCRQAELGCARRALEQRRRVHVGARAAPALGDEGGNERPPLASQRRTLGVLEHRYREDAQPLKPVGPDSRIKEDLHENLLNPEILSLVDRKTDVVRSFRELLV